MRANGLGAVDPVRIVLLNEDNPLGRTTADLTQAQLRFNKKADGTFMTAAENAAPPAKLQYK